MEGMISYTQAAMERTMKVQEVILRALAKKITWWQAAEIIGISDRQMRRWHERYEEFGFRGLFDRRRGKPSPKRAPSNDKYRKLARVWASGYPISERPATHRLYHHDWLVFTCVQSLEGVSTTLFQTSPFPQLRGPVHEAPLWTKSPP